MVSPAAAFALEDVVTAPDGCGIIGGYGSSFFALGVVTAPDRCGIIIMGAYGEK